MPVLESRPNETLSKIVADELMLSGLCVLTGRSTKRTWKQFVNVAGNGTLGSENITGNNCIFLGSEGANRK
jgi:hypothetical protein